MVLPKLVALSGHKGSGKDTAGLYLVNELGYRHISFAYKLKNIVADTYGVPRSWMDDRDKKEMPLTNIPAIPTDPFSEKIHEMLRDELSSGFWTPRALCILEGSIKRAVHSNFWVREVVNSVLNSEYNYVLTDLRYANEADTLKLMIPGCTIIRINRPDNIITTQDPSERNLDNYHFDEVITNDSSIEELGSKVLSTVGRK